MPTTIKTWGLAGDSTPETVTNAKLNQMVQRAEEQAALSALFAPSTASNGLYFGFQKGRIKSGGVPLDVIAGTVLLSAGTAEEPLDNYIEVDSAGIVSANVEGFTPEQRPIGVASCDEASILGFLDQRVGFDFDGGDGAGSFDIDGLDENTSPADDDYLGGYSAADGEMRKYPFLTFANYVITKLLSTARNYLANYIDMDVITSPSNPVAGKRRLYFKTGGGLFYKDDVGAETAVSSGFIPYTIIDDTGDLLVGATEDGVGILSVGTNGQVLTADSGEALGVKWATPAGGATETVVTATESPLIPDTDIEKYRLRLDFDGETFANKFYRTVLKSTDGSDNNYIAIVENLAEKTTGQMEWILFVNPEINPGGGGWSTDFEAKLLGAGWTGGSTLTGTWSITAF